MGSELPIYNNTIIILKKTNKTKRILISDIEARLRGDDYTANYGRVEIKIGNKWGTICDPHQSWREEESRVICRQVRLQGHL